MRRRRRPELPGEEIAGAAQVGALLRQRRESRRLTQENVARTLKCGVRRIASVEAGRFEELPPNPYARGLVAAYAALVDLDAPALLRACGAGFGLEGGAAQGAGLLRPPSERFSWRDWTVPLALAAILAVFVVARSVLAPVEATLEEPAAAPAAPGPAPQQAAAGDSAAPPEPAAAPAEPMGVRVLLRSEGTTWVDASADGSEPKRHELGPGQNLELAARDKLSLSLGDAGVVRFVVNDRDLGFIGFKGEAKSGIVFPARKPPAARPAAGRPGGAAGGAAGD